MVARLFLLALFSAAIAARHVENPLTDEETLRRLTEEAARQAVQVTARVEKVREEFTSITKDRMDSLLWQSFEHKNQLNKVIKDAVSKGIEKNKPYEKFHCIAKNAREAFAALDTISSQIQLETQNNITLEVASLTEFKHIMKEFGEYIEDFYETKIGELNRAPNESARKKIIKSVNDRMGSLRTILDDINRRITNAKYNFFEKYIHYAFDRSNKLRKVHSEVAENIKKCVA